MTGRSIRGAAQSRGHPVVVQVRSAPLDTAQGLTSKCLQAWQARPVLAAAHGFRRVDKKLEEALERARSLGFHGDAPAPTLPNVAASY